MTNKKTSIGGVEGFAPSVEVSSFMKFLSREYFDKTVDNFERKIDSGEGWEVYLFAAFVCKAMEEVRRRALPDALEELEQHPDNQYLTDNFAIAKVESKGIPEYKKDNEYRLLLEALERRKKQLKAAISAAHTRIGGIVSGDGEQVPVVPVKFSKESISLKLK